MASDHLEDYPPEDKADMDNEDEDDEDEASSPTASPKRGKKKRDNSALRKAPQAPKRFKSSYICFFMAKQPEIKDDLGEKATVTEISKRSAEMWRNLPAEERAHWDEVAAKDKQRYMVEKASYTGPWQVPWKRAKKDPSAPKRPMSAFLYFSQGRRRKIKDANPKLKNTEVSRMLGELWRNASEEERKPHIDNEKEEREKYKVAIADWRKDYEEKMESQRKTQAEQAANWTPAPAYNPDSNDVSNPQVPYGDPNVPYVHPMYMHPPAAYYPPQHHHPYYTPAYPPHPGNYPYPTNGKQHVILGPNGMPHYPKPASGPPQHQQGGGYPAQAQSYDENPGPSGMPYDYMSNEPQTVE